VPAPIGISPARWDDSGVVRGVSALGVAALGVAVGVFALDVARDDPAYWFAGGSTLAGAALLTAGWTLIACGLAFWWRRPESRFGPLLAAAGFAWFAPELNNPGVDSTVAFTIGLTLGVACPALVGHAVLVYPRGSLSSRVERCAVALAYGGAVVVLGVLPALFNDPAAHACGPCPRNLALIADRTSTAEDIAHAALYLGVVWALALSALAAVRLRRGSPSARPVLAAGIVYLASIAATFAVSLERGFLANGAFERRLWFVQSAALVALVASVGWGWVRARRARSAVARLVLDLSQSPSPGGLRDVLAAMVGDPELVLAYPLGSSGRHVDARGRPVVFSARQQRTPLTRDGRPVAVIGHEPGVLDDEQLVDEVTAAARLGLENERLQAEVQAQLEELRASRARIVQAGDAERKRLERDLHDGAQQRLVGVALSLRLLRSQHPSVSSLEEAAEELRVASSELRELAHGIFPAVLADEGLAAAIEALAEDGRVPIRVGRLPERRFEATVESAAYTVVAEAVRSGTSGLAVRGEHAGGTLALEVEADSDEGFDVLGLQDRIGALDGRLEVANEGGHVRILAELPCAS
jgi:signal transduction histidine kinase